MRGLCVDGSGVIRLSMALGAARQSRLTTIISDRAASLKRSSQILGRVRADRAGASASGEFEGGIVAFSLSQHEAGSGPRALRYSAPLFDLPSRATAFKRARFS
jgi:hypothetical protein